MSECKGSSLLSVQPDSARQDRKVGNVVALKPA
jgi:hypothetical protein